jgi:hypothetical protein
LRRLSRNIGTGSTEHWVACIRVEDWMGKK